MKNVREDLINEISGNDIAKYPLHPVTIARISELLMYKVSVIQI